MYRVELKELPGLEGQTDVNAVLRFLMYRVELKDFSMCCPTLSSSDLFLMYRVELKGFL